ncbi:MAG TPA: sigma-70 family RNA polymerase sigma factor [Chloroflexota bacterium]
MAFTQLSLDSTQHLVRRSRAGDDSAFAELVEAHQAAVLGTVLRLVCDRETAAEVTNRAFFKAYEHLASFDDARPLRAWLVRIAANEALNELRTRRRDATYTFGGAQAEIALEQLPGAPDPGEIISRRERGTTIRAAVNRLPEAQRVAVVLRYFADLAYSDIAELTQQSVNSVGVTLLRARERLRRDLEGQGVATNDLP